jgi:hypothetical protein
MGNSKGIAVISAATGGIDQPAEYVGQDLDASYLFFTDDYLRRKELGPRLQAKIPKMFGWQLDPGYEFYLWVDGNIALARPDALTYLMEQIEGHDIVVLRHHRRPNIRQDVRYLRKGLRPYIRQVRHKTR